MKAILQSEFLHVLFSLSSPSSRLVGWLAGWLMLPAHLGGQQGDERRRQLAQQLVLVLGVQKAVHQLHQHLYTKKLKN
jgi:hypothetical protein